MRFAICAVALALGACAEEPAPTTHATTDTTGETSMTAAPAFVAEDHAALLASADPQLAANKRLVYDMYRIVLQGGYADRAGEFIAEDYVQHNPMADQGLAGVQDYIRKTRPERPLEDRLELPLIHLMAEGNYVQTAFLRTERDSAGQEYHSTWFDLYRIEDGKIVEHWDPMLKTDTPIDPNSQRLDS
jgi:predicted SnoaL-like aldol condensation-catalyzing enzyme